MQTHYPFPQMHGCAHRILSSPSQFVPPWLLGNKIDIRISKGKEPDTTRVSVFNTGKQIPKEDIGHIWDKFYKVDKAHTREYGGNGIGLSIVKAIMESFHHEYGVNNYENGVEFWFELSAK